ncbi:MAG: enoyl-CoA hydratase-related protein [Bacillota bacterium]|nr:enoyl-CoA hydratase [Bacillota bacterium]
MTVLLEERLEDGRIAVLTMNRPAALNALNTEMAQALYEAMERLSEEKAVRVIILTGAGEKAFCTGGDFKERNNMTEEEWHRQHRLFQKVARAFRRCPKPVIAAVNGYALGGGCELALSCDFVYASHNAAFGLPEVSRGIIPGIGGTQLISRFLPRGMALEMLLTGRHLPAEEARQWGMVNRVVPLAELLPAVLATAKQIAANSPHAVRMAKRAFVLGVDHPLEEGIEIALESYHRAISHPDRIEGTRAFVEKRPPRYMDA